MTYKLILSLNSAQIVSSIHDDDDDDDGVEQRAANLLQIVG